VRRQLRGIAQVAGSGRRVVIQAHPRIAEVISRNGEVARLEKQLSLKLTVEPAPAMNPDGFSILQG